MANLSHSTRCGLPGIEWVPFGSTLATFIAALTSSLRRWCRTLSRERCLWVTAPLLPAREHAPRVGMLIFVEGKDDERC